MFNQAVHLNQWRLLWLIQTSGIVIPKIDAMSPIVANVDPYDSTAYQQALALTVWHRQKVRVPTDSKTNVPLRSFSAATCWWPVATTLFFYLLNKMATDDEITIYYHNLPYTYQGRRSNSCPWCSKLLRKKKKYSRHWTEFLMTCALPGTTWTAAGLGCQTSK